MKSQGLTLSVNCWPVKISQNGFGPVKTDLTSSHTGPVTIFKIIKCISFRRYLLFKNDDNILLHVKGES